MTFSEQFIYLLDGLTQRIGVAIDWTGENVMPYVQDLLGRYIGYHSTMYLIAIGLSVLAGIIGFILVLMGYSKRNKPYCDEFFYYAIGIPLGIISIVLSVSLLPDFLETIFVPEFYLYEQLMNLLD